MVIPFYCEDYPENPDDFEIVDDAKSPLPPKKSPNDAATQPARATLKAATQVFKELAATLGLFRAPVEEESAQDDSLVEPLMTLLIDLRRAAKKNKDFATADEIRNRLKELGVSLEDRPGGVCVWTRERS